MRRGRSGVHRTRWILGAFCVYVGVTFLGNLRMRIHHGTVSLFCRMLLLLVILFCSILLLFVSG